MKSSLAQIKASLNELEIRMREAEKNHQETILACHKNQKISASNLIHYLTLRNEDIRELQDKLHVEGLSSLASAEGHILSQIQAIESKLDKKIPAGSRAKSHFELAKITSKKRAEMLFGARKADECPSIMVTFDTGFADNYTLIKTLMQNGMNVARINCAHDHEEIWSKMIYLVKKACRKTGLECKIYMDLAGPKIRTMLIHKGKKKGKVKIKEGDVIWLSEKEQNFRKKDIVVFPNEHGIISCLKKGNRIFIDDGIIKGEVEKVYEDKVKVRIVRAAGEVPQIKNGKGINFPDSQLNIQSLTDFDLECLPFICEHADLVGYSFVRYPVDLQILQEKLSLFAKIPPSVIIKIETPEAVQNLPALLLKGMQKEVFGVMIARGDLAVEIGFERMGEIQEEILWICESAHVPVIWATQVLESLNKSGMATRSEITDAARAAMAECVMINKGDFTLEVLETLKEILLRMGGHHVKKRFTLRPLSIAQRFFNPNY